MNDINDNHLKPEQSWLKAEKMLDTHFRRKRIIAWTLSLFISGLVIVGSILVFHFQDKNSSLEKNAMEANSTSFTSPEKTNMHSSITPQNISPASSKSSPLNNKSVVNDKTRQENKAGGQSSANQRNAKANAEKIQFDNKAVVVSGKKNKEKVVPASASNRVDPNVKSMAAVFTLSTPEPTTIGEKENSVPNSMFSLVDDSKSKGARSSFHTDASTPDLVYMKAIQRNEIPNVLTENYLVSIRSEKQIPVSLENPFHLRLSVYVGAHYTTKSLDSKNYTEYVNRRKNEEEGIISNSFGIALSHAVKNMSIGLGIEFSTWGEERQYLPYLNKESAVENGNYQPYYRVDTNSIYNFGILYFQTFQVLDSNFVSQIDTVVQQVSDPSVSSSNNNNHFSFIELPVDFSYRFIHGKIGVGASAGISPAWLIGKEGYLLKRDLTGLESIAEIKSVNEFMLNGKFSIDLYFRMNNRMDVLLRPQLKANLNSLFKSDYDVNQHYFATGLLFGIQYLIR